MPASNTPLTAKLIDRQLLDELTDAAQASPRQRKNLNFHPADDFPAHRLLNAIEPGSYIRPHRHLDIHKDETMLVLRGRLGLLSFDDQGEIVQSTVLSANGECCGVDIPHGCWHTVLALESGTLFLEAKSGPYAPLTPEECAPWAPAEGDAQAAAQLAAWQQRLK